MFRPENTFIHWGPETAPAIATLTDEDTESFWQRFARASTPDGYAQAHAMTFGRGVTHAVPCVTGAMRSMLDYTGPHHAALHAAARVVITHGVVGLFRNGEGGTPVPAVPPQPRDPQPVGAARNLIFGNART